MRLAGVLILFAVSTAAGYMKSMSLKARVQTVEELLLFLAEYKAALPCSVMPIYVIVERLAAGRRYPHLGFLRPWSAAMREGAAPEEAWASLAPGTLSPAFCESFAGFCGALGKSDRAAQEALCNTYTDVFSKLRESCHQSYLEKGGLYRSIGWYAGAFLAVLFI